MKKKDLKNLDVIHEHLLKLAIRAFITSPALATYVEDEGQAEKVDYLNDAFLERKSTSEVITSMFHVYGCCKKTELVAAFHSFFELLSDCSLLGIQYDEATGSFFHPAFSPMYPLRQGHRVTFHPGDEGARKVFAQGDDVSYEQLVNAVATLGLYVHDMLTTNSGLTEGLRFKLCGSIAQGLTVHLPLAFAKVAFAKLGLNEDSGDTLLTGNAQRKDYVSAALTYFAGTVLVSDDVANPLCGAEASALDSTVYPLLFSDALKSMEKISCGETHLGVMRDEAALPNEQRSMILARQIIGFGKDCDPGLVKMAQAVSKRTSQALTDVPRKIDVRATKLLDWARVMSTSTNSSTQTMEKERKVANTMAIALQLYVYAVPLISEPKSVQSVDELFGSRQFQDIEKDLVRRITAEFNTGSAWRAYLHPLLKHLAGADNGLVAITSGNSFFAPLEVRVETAPEGGQDGSKTVGPAASTAGGM